ncbi:hypothetical protein ABZ605_08455 [Streptomyces sp. NPDC012765]|uniref:hypothetical protein n=1 Tax=Streptomyces sp. NPDC012765 TaxID=3155249 RepID=UPI0033F49CF7
MQIPPAVVLHLVRDGYTPQRIAEHLRTDVATVTGIIRLHNELTSRGPDWRPPAGRRRPGIAKLLAWADHHSRASIRRRAARVHRILDELLADHQAEGELLVSMLEVADLERQLAAARTRTAALMPRAGRTR